MELGDTASPTAARYWSDCKRDLVHKATVDTYTQGVCQLSMLNDVVGEDEERSVQADVSRWCRDELSIEGK
ncbi:MAG: hypothetical protein H0X24_01770 [Ktedonobacterales bacterium]|nr:hypothetical protein [Ktedonobacterales bacterium]